MTNSKLQPVAVVETQPPVLQRMRTAKLIRAAASTGVIFTEGQEAHTTLFARAVLSTRGAQGGTTRLALKQLLRLQSTNVASVKMVSKRQPNAGPPELPKTQTHLVGTQPQQAQT